MSKLGKKGYTQGDMSPVVDNYERPMSEFSQQGFNKTTEYVERRNRFDTKQASDVKKQDYKGRYS